MGNVSRTANRSHYRMNDRMPLLIDANVTTRSDSDAGESIRSSKQVATDLERTKRELFVEIPTTTMSVTFVPSPSFYLESGGFWDPSPPANASSDSREAFVKAWESLQRESWFFSVPPDRFTRATRPTSTTISSVARLLRRHHRDERLRRMSSAARASYNRIRSLRAEIGPVDFDVVKALRELRDDG